MGAPLKTESGVVSFEEGGEVEIDLDDGKLTFSYAPTASDREELAEPAETVE